MGLQKESQVGATGGPAITDREATHSDLCRRGRPGAAEGVLLASVAVGVGRAAISLSGAGAQIGSSDRQPVVDCRHQADRGQSEHHTSPEECAHGKHKKPVQSSG